MSRPTPVLVAISLALVALPALAQRGRGERPGRPGADRPVETPARITFWEHSNYRGQSITLEGPEEDFRSIRWNDKASSFRVESGEWEVCKDTEYRGCVNIKTLGGGASDLDRVGWNDRISSLRPLFVEPPVRPQEEEEPAVVRGPCHGEVQFRVWTQDGHEWFDVDDEVVVYRNQESHIYVHVKGRGDTPYTTAAEFGYAEKWGYTGKVKPHLDLIAQNDSDRRDGRMRLTPRQPGLAQMGYSLIGVRHPGKIEDVPKQCRQGLVKIRVKPRSQM